MAEINYHGAIFLKLNNGMDYTIQKLYLTNIYSLTDPTEFNL